MYIDRDATDFWWHGASQINLRVPIDRTGPAPKFAEALNRSREN